MQLRFSPKTQFMTIFTSDGKVYEMDLGQEPVLAMLDKVLGEVAEGTGYQFARRAEAPRLSPQPSPQVQSQEIDPGQLPAIAAVQYHKNGQLAAIALERPMPITAGLMTELIYGGLPALRAERQLQAFLAAKMQQ